MTTATLPDDPTLDEIRAALAPLVARAAAFDGWSRAAVTEAARDAGVDPDIAALAFPGGAADMIDGWFAHIDAAMLAALPPEKLNAMKVRERITALVEARLALLAPDRESLRRAQSVLVLPQNAPRALRLGWRAADVMWRAAGDTASDFNHYSKRTILASLYAATLALFVNDDSVDYAETRAFLARRIDNVMQFEKWKARRSGAREHRFSFTRLAGRLRYPGK
jgi:ubiquinone biosynthesis protein COQ9